MRPHVPLALARPSLRRGPFRVPHPEGSRQYKDGQYKVGFVFLPCEARPQPTPGLSARPPSASSARLLLFSANGFERNLVAAAKERKDVELIDLRRMYVGE